MAAAERRERAEHDGRAGDGGPPESQAGIRAVGTGRRGGSEETVGG